jgi:Multicopper oxidase
MKDFAESRREFLKTTGAIAGGFLLWPRGILAQTKKHIQQSEPVVSPSESAAADYTLHIETSPVEIAPKRIISATAYNGQFPRPLLRFKEGQQVTVDLFNDTDTPEQLHWHGRRLSNCKARAGPRGSLFSGFGLTNSESRNESCARFCELIDRVIISPYRFTVPQWTVDLFR